MHETQEYFDHHFASNEWEKNNGRNQTRYFAREAIERLSSAVTDTIEHGTLLDWACALGDASDEFHKWFPEASITGYDWSSEAIKKARSYYPDLTFTSNEAELTTYDVVYCSNMLEHVQNFQEYMHKQAALARKYYVVVVPWDEGPALVPHHCVWFKQANMPCEVRNCEFHDLKLYRTDEKYWYGSQVVITYKKTD